MVTVYLAIGTNLGNRKVNIKRAIQELKELRNTKVVKVAEIFDTKPVGGPLGQGDFLNSAVKIETTLPPFVLLKELKLIENKMGRKETVLNGPRIIDLDILFYADRIIDTKKLSIPHPRLGQRDFVMKPLLQLL